MEKKKEYKSALKVQEGISQPPCVNPDVLTKSGRKRRKKYSVDEYVAGILSGNRTILSQAITLVESSLSEHNIIVSLVFLATPPSVPAAGDGLIKASG